MGKSLPRPHPALLDLALILYYAQHAYLSVMQTGMWILFYRVLTYIPACVFFWLVVSVNSVNIMVNICMRWQYSENNRKKSHNCIKKLLDNLQKLLHISSGFVLSRGIIWDEFCSVLRGHLFWNLALILYYVQHAFLSMMQTGMWIMFYRV